MPSLNERLTDAISSVLRSDPQYQGFVIDWVLGFTLYNPMADESQGHERHTFMSFTSDIAPWLAVTQAEMLADQLTDWADNAGEWEMADRPEQDDTDE